MEPLNLVKSALEKTNINAKIIYVDGSSKLKKLDNYTDLQDIVDGRIESFPSSHFCKYSKLQKFRFYVNENGIFLKLPKNKHKKLKDMDVLGNLIIVKEDSEGKMIDFTVNDILFLNSVF